MKLSIDRLSFSYDSRSVLQDISFDLHEGEFLSVLGPNGVGKSTLFRCILGRLDGYTGSITADGQALRTLSRREQAKLIAYIPQIHMPSFDYTVLDTVLMGTARQVGAFSRPNAQQTALALEALGRVGIAELADRNFNRLSGGEQQLVLIARALAQQARILIMDEPTSALDYGNQLRVLRLVRALAGEGYAVLLSTHNPQHALTFATRILALSGGRVAALGEPQDVMTRELIDRLYGVDTAFADVEGRRVIVPLMQETVTPQLR